MRVPLSWLADFVDAGLAPDELAELLTNAGLEVRGIDRIGVEGADLPWPRDLVMAAKILRVDPVPDADRLVLATVDHGSGTRQVVTGAPNLFPHLGQDLEGTDLWGALLLAGASYRNPYRDLKITKLKPKKLRGITSDAMLCSAVELGLGEDHDGILLFQPADELPALRPGRPLVEVFGDVVLDIDVIPNIARCASILGVAREVAALTGAPLKPPSLPLAMDGPPVAGRVEVTTENPELNPRFCALLIEGIEQGPSPAWMQHRLELAGQRPIGVVVDISNYVMLELGQPNHTFDHDHLRQRAEGYASDGQVRIVTRLAQEGERIVTLDGAERTLKPNQILVTDEVGALTVGGVMGGRDSEIGPETRNVLLEAAAWEPRSIRRTQRQLGIHTEAGFRFSRGVHPSQAMDGARRVGELLRLHAGGTVAAGIVDHHPMPAPAVTVDFELGYLHRQSGLDLDGEETANLLRRLDFTVVKSGDDRFAVTVPDHRLDIEGPHDLVEEVCRMYGYDRIPSTVLRDALPPQRGNRLQALEDRAKDTFADLGLQEIVSYRLTTPEAEAKLDPEASATAAADSEANPDPEAAATAAAPVAKPDAGADDVSRPSSAPTSAADSEAQPGEARPEPASPGDATNAGSGRYVRLANPSTLDRVVMRHSLLASVLEAAASNARFSDRLALFEVGAAYPLAEGESLPDERLRAALVLTGPRRSDHWQHGAGGQGTQGDQGADGSFDFFDLKGVVEAALEALGIEAAFAPAEDGRPPAFRPGRTATVKLAGESESLGWLGEVHPVVVDQFGLEPADSQTVLAAELDLDLIFARASETVQVEPAPVYPAIREDLALIVDEAVPAANVKAALLKAGKPLLREVELFDVFRGDAVGAGSKSLAWHLAFRAPNRTLRDRDTAKLRRRILAQVERAVGARLRE